MDGEAEIIANRSAEAIANIKAASRRGQSRIGANPR